ncbi:MAG: ABC transporter permease [Deltaproteobacteria bacterium]|nr:ABC transporter permease [Deltaproteobacteria bacterium]
MKAIVAIAYRNLLRNKKRSFIIILAITIGLGAIVFLRGFASGAQRQMVDNIVSVITSEISIVHKSMENIYNTNGTIEDPETVRRLLRGDPRVAGFAEEVFGSGIVSSPQASIMTFVSGIDPQQEIAIGSRFPIVSGRLYAPDDDHSVIVGEKMRKILGIELGEKVVVTVQDQSGGLTGESFTLIGTLEIGNDQLDSGTVVVSLGAGKRLLGMGDRLSKFAVKTTHRDHIPGVVKDLRGKLSGTDLMVMTWDELIPMMAQMMRFQDGMIFVVLLIVLSVVTAGILNTLLMSIVERTREFGLMLALGTKPLQVISLLVFETILLSLAGISGGISLGILAILYFGHVGIDLSRFVSTFSNLLVGSHVFPRVDWTYIGLFLMVVLVSNILIAFYPAWRASRLQPVEAMRQVG